MLLLVFISACRAIILLQGCSVTYATGTKNNEKKVPTDSAHQYWPMLIRPREPGPSASGVAELDHHRVEVDK
ncbi:hypothetical protein OH492_28690 [Vibrio chagasii]|nr:hypothetical protein [Vibrio chagasii]